MASKFVGQANLLGKQVLISGGTQGIGLQAARVYASLGANVTLACRNMPDGRRAIEQDLIPYRDKETKLNLDELKQ